MAERSFLDTKIADVVPETGGGACACCFCTSVALVLSILFFPAYVIQLGQHKVGLVKNRMSGVVELNRVYTPGRYWIGFWREFVEFPTTLQTIQFSDETPEAGVQPLRRLEARDRAGERVYLDITVQYRVNPEAVGQIYREFTNLFEDVYISELRDVITREVGQFNIREAWEDFPRINDILKDACVVRLATRNALCWGLQLWGIQASNRYENRIVDTQVQRQRQRTEEQRLVHRKYRAETVTIQGDFNVQITRIRAAGSAQVIQIQGEARARAESYLVEAQSNVLNMVRDTVVLPLLDGSNTTMTADQIMQYQKMVMLQSRSLAHFTYNFKSPEEIAASAR
jgi:regulator of protease activity HflC (stomatin/prohibitin superfamily)